MTERADLLDGERLHGDLGDRAQFHEEHERAAGLAAQQERAHAHAEPPLFIDGERSCRDCEEPISRERLAANADAVRCVECQGRHDRQTETLGMMIRRNSHNGMRRYA